MEKLKTLLPEGRSSGMHKKIQTHIDETCYNPLLE